MNGSRISSGIPGSDVGICRPKLQSATLVKRPETERRCVRRVGLVLRLVQGSIVNEILWKQMSMQTVTLRVRAR